MTQTSRLSTARAELSRRIEHWFELPMAVLGVAWLLLLVFELLRAPTRGTEMLTVAIWIAFSLEFGIRFALAPRKLTFLRRNGSPRCRRRFPPSASCASRASSACSAPAGRCARCGSRA